MGTAKHRGVGQGIGGGAPSTIDRIVGQTTRDGVVVDVTASDRILASVRAGTPLAGAAGSAGIRTETFYEWIREGVRAETHLLAGKDPDELSEHQHRLAKFAHDVFLAEGEWEASGNTILEQLARGGSRVITNTTKRDAEGNVIESTEKVEILPPSAAVLQWRLKTRFPERYVDRRELSGPGGGAIPVDLVDEQALADSVFAYLEGVNDTAEAPETAGITATSDATGEAGA